MLKKVSQAAFYLAITIELIIVILDKSVYIIQYEGQWFRLTFALFLFKLLLTKYNTKEKVAIAAFIVFGAISYLCSGHNEILRLIVMVAACKDINYRYLLKFIFFFTLAGCAALVILSFAGIGIFSITTDFGRGEVDTRYCLGMGHPNALHCMYWSLCVLGLYIYEKQIKTIHFLLLMIGNVGLFILTDSRTGFLATILTLGMFFLLRLAPVRNRSNLLCVLFIIVCALSFILSYLMMNNDLFWSKLRQLDDIVTGRILWTHMGIIQSKTWFWLPFSAHNRFAQTDLGFVKMVYWYGYIPTLVFLVMCCILVRTALKKGDYAVWAVTLSIVIYSIFEGHTVSVYHGRNYIYFLWAIYWSEMLGLSREDKKADKCIVSRGEDGSNILIL